MVVGNHQDGMDHTVREYTLKVNSKAQKEKYAGYENDLILDEVALAKALQIFGGQGKSGAITKAQEGCSVTKHLNKSNTDPIATLPFGYCNEGDTSSFSLKLNPTKASSRSRSQSSESNSNTSNYSSDSSGDEEFISKITLLKAKILDKSAEGSSNIKLSGRQGQLLHSIVFDGLKRKKETNKNKKMYSDLTRRRSKKLRLSKIEK